MAHNSCLQCWEPHVAASMCHVYPQDLGRAACHRGALPAVSHEHPKGWRQLLLLLLPPLVVGAVHHGRGGSHVVPPPPPRNQYTFRHPHIPHTHPQTRQTLKPHIPTQISHPALGWDLLVSTAAMQAAAALQSCPAATPVLGHVALAWGGFLVLVNT